MISKPPRGNSSFQSSLTRNIGPVIRIFQLNVESISRAKCDYLSKVLMENNIDVVVLQETHVANEEQFRTRGRITGYTALGVTYHEAYGVATYIRNNIRNAELLSQSTDEYIHRVSIKLNNITVVNVYKPPGIPWPQNVIPVERHPAVYVGDFNSHHEFWRYSKMDDCGLKLMDWCEDNNLHLVFDAKDKGTFRSAAWGRDSNPDLCFVSSNINGNPLHTTRKVLGDFPHSQHRPVIIELGATIPIIQSIPHARWNFQKADWSAFSAELDKCIRWIPPKHYNYQRLVGAIISTAKKFMPRGYRKEYIPCWNAESQELYDNYQQNKDTETADKLLSSLDISRRQKWIQTVEGLDFTRSSRKAWSLLRKLGESTPVVKSIPQITPDQIASHIATTSRVPGDKKHTKHIRCQLHALKSTAPCASSYSRPFTPLEVQEALKDLKPGKASGFDGIHPEFLIHMGENARRWFAQFFTDILQTGKIPPEFKKAKIISLLKPGKSPNSPDSYRPISLLSCCYKLFERLIYNRISPTILDLIPVEQAGFRPKRSCSDQVLALTSHIEAGFQKKYKTSAVFVDLTAAFDTVWREGVIYKLLKSIPCRTIARLVNNMLSDRKFQVCLGEEMSTVRKLKNGLPQGSVLSPLLFNLYISDLPETTARKFCYADDLALATQHKNLEKTEEILTKDLSTLDQYFKKWRLRPSAAKTEVSCFHLNNRLANTKLNISFSDRVLNHNNFPKYLGVTLDRTLSFKQHLLNLSKKVKTRNNIIQKLCGTTWGSPATILRSSSLALVFSAAEYCAPVWLNSPYTRYVDPQLNTSMRLISGTIRSTPTHWLPLLSGIMPPDLRRTNALLREYTKICSHHQLPILDDIPTLNLRRLKSRNPPIRDAAEKASTNFSALAEWKDRWMTSTDLSLHNVFIGEKIAGGSQLPRRTWTRLNRIRTGHGRCRDSFHKWNIVESPECDCRAPRQTISHIVNECPLRAYPGNREDFNTPTEEAIKWLETLDIQL